eukprot:TRINITY_DN26234_c0_g1_i1.p1 TRINITY_DN26234_c0_g1~~TRINITY_DN26234_c0_g1_i1.p1  ORF type:complete len:135 (-),score=32.52 TRINITY_DN26234_c0_g1_i1:293-697(-)
MEDIKNYVVRQFRPSCLVFSTESARAMCRENYLTPAELLRPFGDLRNEVISMFAGEKNGYQAREFVIDFYDVWDYELVASHVQLNVRHAVIRKHAPELPLQNVPRCAKNRKEDIPQKSCSCCGRRGIVRGDCRF